MTRWSEQAIENAAERRKIQKEEASDALVDVLCTLKPRQVVQKRRILGAVADRVKRNRRRDGALLIPTVNNKEVRAPGMKWIANHWSDICQHAADNGKYVIWVRGRGGGCRLGTLDEYTENQRAFPAIASGLADRHNERADIINKKGGESGYLTPPLLESPR